jgi:hypothetical protein
MWFLASWVPKAWKYEAGSHLVFAPDGEHGERPRPRDPAPLAHRRRGVPRRGLGHLLDRVLVDSVALVAAAVSLVAIVVTWARTIPPINMLGAFTVDVALIVAALVPSFGDRLTGA